MPRSAYAKVLLRVCLGKVERTKILLEHPQMLETVDES